MSKAITPALKAHFAQGSTTRAWCWRLERVDGLVRTITTWATDLPINGEIYRARDGVNPMAIEGSADGSVANTEISGALSAELVTEAEIVSGLWDNCFVVVFEVNARDLTMGRLALMAGWIGGTKAGSSTFHAEVRSLAQALQQQIGDLYSPICRAQLGDSMCRVNVEAMRFTSALTAVQSRRKFTDASATQPDDWFGAGLLRVESGDFAGLLIEAHEFSAGVYTLVLPLPFDPYVGMTYSVLPGCRKRHERGGLNPAGISDCKDKFNNVINFQGEPPAMFPGNNRILGLGSMMGVQG